MVMQWPAENLMLVLEVTKWGSSYAYKRCSSLADVHQMSLLQSPPCLLPSAPSIWLHWTNCLYLWTDSVSSSRVRVVTWRQSCYILQQWSLDINVQADSDWPSSRSITRARIRSFNCDKFASVFSHAEEEGGKVGGTSFTFHQHSSRCH